MAQHFKPGDRVSFIRHTTYYHATVLGIHFAYNNYIELELDSPHQDCHNGQDRGKPGHCWYVEIDLLIKIPGTKETSLQDILNNKFKLIEERHKTKTKKIVLDW